MDQPGREHRAYLRQGSPYRLYQYDLLGLPTAIEHRDIGGGVLHEQLEWDGAGGMRRVLNTDAGLERHTAVRWRRHQAGT